MPLAHVFSEVGTFRHPSRYHVQIWRRRWRTDRLRQNNGHPGREEIPFRHLLRHGARTRELLLQTLFRCTDLISRSDVRRSRDTHLMLLLTRVDYYCVNLLTMTGIWRPMHTTR